MKRKTRNREEHHADFKYLGPDGDRALAEAIGEVAASHGKQDEGKREERADEQDLGLFFIGRKIGADDEVENQVFQSVVVKRALKLRRDQIPEAETPEAGNVVHVRGTSANQTVGNARRWSQRLPRLSRSFWVPAARR